MHIINTNFTAPVKEYKTFNSTTNLLWTIKAFSLLAYFADVIVNFVCLKHFSFLF